jgi:hypothetical protein
MAASPSGPHEPSIVTSQVFQALYRAVKLARGGSRLVYFPWHSAKDEQLREIAAQLNFIFLPALPDTPNPENARGLRAFIDAMSGPAHRPTSLADAHKALGEWPETEQLLEVAVKRIKAVIGCQNKSIQGVLLFCPRSMPSADEWTARAVRLAHARMGLPVVVASSLRPSLDGIRSTDIRWEHYHSDVNAFFDQLQRSEAEAEQTQTTPTASQDSERIRKNKQKRHRLCKGFISFLHDLVWQDTSLSVDAAPAAGAAVAGSPDPDVDDPRWSALVARLSFPDTSRALAIFEEWADHELEEGPLAPDELVRRGRERFLTLLRDLDKEAYSAACHDLDGADQLYKIHLVLCGGAHRESLLSGVLLPFWQQRFDNALFRELFLDCFGSSGQEHPLVQRFESRTQLSKHLRRHSSGSEGDAQNAAEAARRQFRGWVDAVAKDLAKIAEVEQQREKQQQDPVEADTPPPAALGEFVKVLEAVKEAAPECDAGDSLEFAQMLMSGLELFTGVDEPQKLAARIDPVITRLIKSALARSQGAVRFEATLLQARQLATVGRLLDAAAVLRDLRRTHNDSFRTVAIEVEEAHVLERRKDYIGASRAYLQALKQAERISADELSARAVLGQLRCDIAGGFMKGTRADAKQAQRLRAQAMVQIQQARAPELVAISPDKVPRVFVSYRADSRPLSNCLAKELTGDHFVAWNDQRIRRCEDFSPAIHRELLNSSAMLLVLGPTFFDSPWCLHELHFALGQNDLRGLPIFWLWSEPGTGNPGDRPIATVISTWQQGWLPQHKYPDYQRAHLQDRLNRVMSKGICLSQTVVSYGPPSEENPEGAFDADPKSMEALLAPVKELLRRTPSLV